MNGSDRAKSRRERRRKQNEEKCESEDNDVIVIKQNKVVEQEVKTSEMENSRILIRNDTFRVPKPRTVFDDYFADVKVKDESSIEEDVDVISHNGIADSDSNSRNLTHTINVETWNTESINLTYNVQNDESITKNSTYNIPNEEQESSRPVPAPRKRHTFEAKELDKNSSDTDKDVMEIEADDGNESNVIESPTSYSCEIQKISIDSDTYTEQPPKPKPRKLSSASLLRSSFRKTDSISKSKSLEEITVKVLSPRSTKSNPETKTEDYAKVDVREETKPVQEEKPKKTKRFAALLQRKKQKKSSKMFSSVIKLERARIPTISSLLRDLKEDKGNTSKTKLEEEEEKFDLHLESPRFPQSAPNDKMYVQYKNGFYLKNRDDVLRQEEELLTNGVGKGKMEGSMTSTMLKTAMMFQKYWSRSMIYFHGMLAGFGFAHAFTITAVLFYFSNDIQGFVNVYACLALKIHFVFYMLTALCIVSCLDRLDVGHLSKKHWEFICSKCTTLWFVLMIYVASFLLTFVNHGTESRFDGHQYENVTGEKLWDPEAFSDVSAIFTCWYRMIWARDIMVLASWLLISLTEYPDNLHVYVKNLATKVDENGVGEASIAAVIS